MVSSSQPQFPSGPPATRISLCWTIRGRSEAQRRPYWVRFLRVQPSRLVWYLIILHSPCLRLPPVTEQPSGLGRLVTFSDSNRMRLNCLNTETLGSKTTSELSISTSTGSMDSNLQNYWHSFPCEQRRVPDNNGCTSSPLPNEILSL